MLKGLSPGTALVLLMAGPAANFASVTVISRTMGKRSAAVYLGSIIAGSIAFGLAIDYLLPREWFTAPLAAAHGACHGDVSSLSLFDTVCSAILVGLLVVAFLFQIYNRYKNRHKNFTDMTAEYHIKGMSCAHCKATVEKNLARIEGVTSVTVDLPSGVAVVEGEHDRDAVIEKIREIGFDPVDA